MMNIKQYEKTASDFDALSKATKHNESKAGDELEIMLNKSAMTPEKVANFEQQEFIYPKTIPKGSSTVIVGDSGVGKTTILLEMARHEAKNGFEVEYFDFDSNEADIKKYTLFATESGFRYHTQIEIPDPDKYIDSLVGYFKTVDCSNRVYIFDTLRMFTDDLEPKKLSRFFKHVRTMIQFRGPIVIAHHTNKRPEDNGSDIFAGLSLIRTNCDNLIYLQSQQQPDGTLLVSSMTDPPRAKRRANLENCSWTIGVDRNVTLNAEHIPILNAVIPIIDEEHIKVIQEILKIEGETIEGKLIAKARSNDVSITRRGGLRILKTYKSKWSIKNGKGSSKIYYLDDLTKKGDDIDVKKYF